MSIDRRLLGWGSFLIIAGVIPLAVRGGALPSNWLEGWLSLWPLLLIGGGLGLLLRGTPIQALGGLVTVLTAGVMVGGLLATGFHGFPTWSATCGSGSGGTAFADHAGTLPDPGRMTIEFNCGSLDVVATDGSGWAITGRGPESRPPVISADNDGVRIRPTEVDGLNIAEIGSTWRVEVPRTPIVELGLTLNAGEGRVDLAGAHVGSTNVTLNAGSLKLDLGAAASASFLNATVNAGDASIAVPAGFESANLSLNAGAVTFCVPSNTQLRVHWSGSLAGNNLGEAGLTEVSKNEWATSGAGTGPAVDLRVSANAGSFTLVVGGSCNA
ncbi:MAG: hypothetical protein ABIQ17_04295 [Candidatus Limnocylindrales bacterium]